MTELKPCPCGEIPKSLIINDGETYRWRRVSGSCCDEWSIDAKVSAGSVKTITVEGSCIAAWNNSTRGK